MARWPAGGRGRAQSWACAGAARLTSAPVGEVTAATGQPRRRTAAAARCRSARPVRVAAGAVAGQCQHVADPVGLQAGPQRSVGDVGLLAGHQGSRDPRRPAPGWASWGQGRLGRNPTRAATPTAWPRSASSTNPWDLSVPVGQGMPGVAGVDQVDRDLGVLDAAAPSGVAVVRGKIGRIWSSFAGE
jgi:hypothetical protein